MLFPLGGGFETPDLVSVVAPVDAARPQLDTVWHVGFRFVFDWRSYW